MGKEDRAETKTVSKTESRLLSTQFIFTKWLPHLQEDKKGRVDHSDPRGSFGKVFVLQEQSPETRLPL